MVGEDVAQKLAALGFGQQNGQATQGAILGNEGLLGIMLPLAPPANGPTPLLDTMLNTQQTGLAAFLNNPMPLVAVMKPKPNGLLAQMGFTSEAINSQLKQIAQSCQGVVAMDPQNLTGGVEPPSGSGGTFVASVGGSRGGDIEIG